MFNMIIQHALLSRLIMITLTYRNILSLVSCKSVVCRSPFCSRQRVLHNRAPRYYIKVKVYYLEVSHITPILEKDWR